MAAAGAADGLLRCVYQDCISRCDTGFEHRPYHRNCGCALHTKSNNKSRGPNICPHGLSMCTNVSYPIRRSWSEGSLAVAASYHSSPGASPVVELGGKPHQLGAYNQDP